MAKSDRVTYLALLEVGAIEDHMAPGAAVRAPTPVERAVAKRVLRPIADRVREGGLAR